MPSKIFLKAGCKVIITRNLVNGLVNGMSATVLKCNATSVDVKIDNDPYLHHKNQGKIVTLNRETFVERNNSNTIVAAREQIPLKLGYALTVDKSQGRIIPFLVVDAYNYWKAGQFGVTIGRATDKKVCRL